MKRILFTVSLFACLFSCSNDDAATPETQDPNFYALTVGNSWVYKNYSYNVNTDTYDDTGVIDSISIVNTEVFEGNTYFKLRRLTTGNDIGITFCNPNGEYFELVRDSLGALIRSDGLIKFTNTNYEERILAQEPWGSIREILTAGETDISLEAGIFSCVNSERYAILTDAGQAPALDKFYYSDGVGLIYDTISFV